MRFETVRRSDKILIISVLSNFKLTIIFAQYLFLLWHFKKAVGLTNFVAPKFISGEEKKLN